MTDLEKELLAALKEADSNPELSYNEYCNLFKNIAKAEAQEAGDE